MTTFAFPLMAAPPCATLRRLAYPAHHAGDTVDRDGRAIGDAPGGIEDAEHHRNAALARQRCEVGGAAAALRDHAADPRKDMAQRRRGDPGHQDVARADTLELAFAGHHAGASGSPADAGGIAVELRVL